MTEVEHESSGTPSGSGDGSIMSDTRTECEQCGFEVRDAAECPVCGHASGSARFDRRRVLKAAGLTSVAGLFGVLVHGASNQQHPASQRAAPDGPPTADREQMKRLSRVRDRGARGNCVDATAMSEVRADVSPGDEISGVIEEISSGELLVFPPGRFTWSSKVQVDVDDWGISCQPDTVFEVPAGWGDGERVRLLNTRSSRRVADNILLEHLTFDSPGRAAPGLNLKVRNRGFANGIHYALDGPTSRGQQTSGLYGTVENRGGCLRIENYRQFNNGNVAGYGGGDTRIGVYVGAGNQGTVHLVNPVLQGFPNNACYVSRHPGTVIVEGGLLMNNNVSAVRMSGGVTVRDTTIVIDTESYRTGRGLLEGDAHNTRGLWGDSMRTGTEGGLAVNTSFILRSYRTSQGLVDILENPILYIDDCQFLLNDDLPAVSGDDGGRIIVTDTTFDADEAGATAGRGSISGSGNCIAPTVTPGTVPAETRLGCEFDWTRTHPETPGRDAG
jgi:hypothetical protein